MSANTARITGEVVLRPPDAVVPQERSPQVKSGRVEVLPSTEFIEEATGLAKLLKKIVSVLVQVWIFITCCCRRVEKNVEAASAIAKKMQSTQVAVTEVPKPTIPVVEAPTARVVPEPGTPPKEVVSVVPVAAKPIVQAPIVVAPDAAATVVAAPAAPVVMVALDEAFLPQKLADKVQCNEVQMKAVAKLLFKNGIAAIYAYVNGRLWEFDPLAGDSRCESRGSKIHSLANSAALEAEAKALKVVIDANMKELDQRDGLVTKRDMRRQVTLSTSSEFYQQKVKTIKVSEDMAYLLQSYFLTITKSISRSRQTGLIYRTYTGAEKEVNDINRLTAFSKTLEKTDIRKAVKLEGIVEHVKMSLAMSSIRYIQGEVTKISKSVLSRDSQEVLQEMSAATIKDGKLVYRCFHSFKCIVMQLQERQALVVVKQMVPTPDEVKKKKSKDKAVAQAPAVQVPKAKPMALLYRASASGESFVPVAANAYAKLKGKPVVVMEAALVAGLTSTQLADKIKAVGGLEKVLFANAAIIDNPADITNEAARKEIEFYQKAAEEMGYIKTSSGEAYTISNPFLLMDHVFCSVVEKEIEIGGE